MKVETRRITGGTIVGEERQLILIPENEMESEALDFVLGDQVPNNRTIATRQLADGYTEDYLRLQRRVL